jgi:hypothetical protein
MTVDQFLALERWVIAMLRQVPDVAEIITARTAVMQLLEPASSTPFPPAPLHDLQTMLHDGMTGTSASLAPSTFTSDDLRTLMQEGLAGMCTRAPEVIRVLTENEKPDDGARPPSTDGLTV